MMQFIKKLPILLCYLVAFVFGMKQLREPDVWWQLLAGRWMVENGAVTHTDVFSYTMAGQPWINVKWLYEVFIHMVENVLGPEGVILLQAIVNVAILWALFHTLKQVAKYFRTTPSNFFTIIAALLFFVMVEYRMSGRPEMVSHLMCALFMSYLWCYPELKWKQLIWPVVLQCLWANMHEGYPVGIVMLGSFATGSFISFLFTRDKNRLQIALRASVLVAAAAIAILVNPNGITLWKQPFEIYRQVWANKYTTELFSYKDAMYWTFQARLHIAVLVSVLVYWSLRMYRAVRTKDHSLFTPIFISYVLWIVLFGYLSLTANRNIPFAQIILFPSVQLMLTDVVRLLGLNNKKLYRSVARYSVQFCIVIAALFYIAVVSNRYYKATDSLNRYGIHTSILHNPTGAVDFIRKHNIKGPAFSDYFVSSYMLWALYPDFRSYIDLRDLDIFSASFFDDYFSIYSNPSKFNELDKKYNFNYAVFSTSQLAALQEQLYWKEGYNLIYIDPVSCIFLKTNKENEILNNDGSIQKLFSWPELPEDPAWAGILTRLLNPATDYSNEDAIYAPIYAAQFYNQVKNFPLAIKMLQPNMADLQENADAYLALGNSYLSYAGYLTDPVEKNRKADSAAIFLEQAKIIDPKKPSVHSLLAGVASLKGNLSGAIEHLEDHNALNDKNDLVYYQLGMCYYSLWKGSRSETDLDKMIKAMKRSAMLNPDNGKPCLYLAEGYLAKKENDEARNHLRKAIASKNPWLPEEEQLLQTLKTTLGVK
jgi:tetratricopeptide (TPR) repeat protein